MLLCSFNGRVVFVKKVFGLGRDHDFSGFCCCFVRRVKPMVTSTSHPPIHCGLDPKHKTACGFSTESTVLFFSLSVYAFAHISLFSLAFKKKSWPAENRNLMKRGGLNV